MQALEGWSPLIQGVHQASAASCTNAESIQS
jgi:hypothetical protein